MVTDYLNELNKAQKEAVVNTEGPALVIAGAGSGKTRVLTYRIAHLLQKGIRAESILALTFTNKAAGEMKERIVSIAGYDRSRYLWMGTFHSIFARILRSESDKLGYPSAFTIYDTTDSRSLIRQIIKELNLDDKIYKPSNIAARISSAKNMLLTARAYAANESIAVKDRSSKIPMMPDIYLRYAARCYKAGAMDFDDLLLNTNILFNDYPDVLNEYRNKFTHILVDEYQDTNYSQYLIVKRLSDSHRNVCVVGDDAQSIYSFRGARIENILNFKNDYPDYKLYKLEQNYRSTQTIVNAANSIIHKNAGQIKKTVFSKNTEGSKIRVMEALTDAEEGFKVASDIFDKHLSFQLRWQEFAVLYRTNAQSRVFEETFRKKNIPYKIYGGLSFYERKEIKDILSYFRIIINPNDEEAIRRTINYPKRGIGKTTVDRLFEFAAESGLSVWKIISEPDIKSSLLTPATWKRIAVYTELIQEFSKQIDGINAYESAVNITAGAGIHKELKNGHAPEDISKFENMQELLNAIKEFTESAETNGEPSGLVSYLESVALLTNQDNEKKEDRDKVTLMTVHSAKGLEFENIYIVGLEENLFPSIMSIGENSKLEEERRLFYVAITRAKSLATLSFARHRYKWGNLEDCKPSRFLDDIDDKYLDYHLNKRLNIKPERNERKSYSFNRDKNSGNKIQAGASSPGRNFKKVSPGNRSTNSTNEEKANIGTLQEGSVVVHDRFGRGVIKAIEGTEPNTTALVDFGKSGEKKLLLRFAKLRLSRE